MGQHLGIYGAGQLGAFLCQAAKALQIETTIISPNPGDTATFYADHVIVAPLDDLAATAQLLSRCDVITFELEDIAESVLQELHQADKTGRVQVAPATAALLLIQNKLSQKSWLVEHNFPTASYVNCEQGLAAADIAKQLGLPFVQKTHRGGYDGRGVQIVRDDGPDSTFWPAASLAEEFVEEMRELAVLVARSRSGEVACYSVVEMEFDPVGNLVRHVVSPAPLSADIASQAQVLAEGVVNALDGIGLFAVERFLTRDQQLLINEIAPRVHNSGHLTIEACETSQYEQHIRAVMGMPLGNTAQQRAACMVNLLNEPALSDVVPYTEPVSTQLDDNTVLHWYGKSPSKPLRKMGHITSLAQSIDEARQQCDDALQDLVSRAGERG